LEQGEIRLFRLSPGKFDAPLEGYLEHTLLYKSGSAHGYNAISYCWGDAQEVASIDVNGVEMQITKNLAAALRSLRLLKKPRYFWIDHICINQCDIAERGRQVE
jgi:hypothetical protein